MFVMGEHKSVCEIMKHDRQDKFGTTGEELEANAALIAAAPELLEKLQRLEKFAAFVEADLCDQDTGWYYQFGSAIEKAQTAIAKATGSK